MTQPKRTRVDEGRLDISKKTLPQEYAEDDAIADDARHFNRHTSWGRFMDAVPNAAVRIGRWARLIDMLSINDKPVPPVFIGLLIQFLSDEGHLACNAPKTGFTDIDIYVPISDEVIKQFVLPSVVGLLNEALAQMFGGEPLHGADIGVDHATVKLEIGFWLRNDSPFQEDALAPAEFRQVHDEVYRLLGELYAELGPLCKLTTAPRR